MLQLIGLLLSISLATAGSPFKYVTFQNLTHITTDSTLTATLKYAKPNSQWNKVYYFSNLISYNYTDLTKTQTSSVQANANQNIQMIFSKVVEGFSILLYCLNWPSGTYTFANFAHIRSQNNNKAGSIVNSNGNSILTIANGKSFNGILEFPLYAHIKTLQWTGVAQQGKTLIFGVGILYPVTCTLPPQHHGLVVKGICTGKYNSQCTYTCQSGYKPATYLSNHCIANGTYQFTAKNTLPSTCIKLTPPSPTPTPSHTPSPTPSPTPTPTPTPTAAPCTTQPADITGLSGSCPTTNSGAACSRSCDIGYSGTVSFTCTAGSWSAASDTCTYCACDSCPGNPAFSNFWGLNKIFMCTSALLITSGPGADFTSTTGLTGDDVDFYTFKSNCDAQESCIAVTWDACSQTVTYYSTFDVSDTTVSAPDSFVCVVAPD